MRRHRKAVSRATRPLTLWQQWNSGTAETRWWGHCSVGSTSESYSARDEAAACRVTSNDRRRPGAQPRNKNAQKHGRRTAEAQRRKKLVNARLKILAYLPNSQCLVPGPDGRAWPKDETRAPSGHRRRCQSRRIAITLKYYPLVGSAGNLEIVGYFIGRTTWEIGLFNQC